MKMKRKRALCVFGVIFSICGCSMISNSMADYAQNYGSSADSGDRSAGEHVKKMQQMEEALKLRFSDSPTVWVRREGALTGVRISADVCFDQTSDVLKPRCSSIIENIAALINRYPKTSVRIEGHTDSLAASGNNMISSKKQALTIRNALIKNNVDNDRLEIYPFGDNQPVASNRTEQGRAKNRRIEILVEPAD